MRTNNPVIGGHVGRVEGIVFMLQVVRSRAELELPPSLLRAAWRWIP